MCDGENTWFGWEAPIAYHFPWFLPLGEGPDFGQAKVRAFSARNVLREAMPSGWANGPEYGGPKPTSWGIITIAVVIPALGTLLVLAYVHAHPN